MIQLLSFSTPAAEEMPPAFSIIQDWSMSPPATRPSSLPMTRAVTRSSWGIWATISSMRSNLPSIQAMTSSARSWTPK